MDSYKSALVITALAAFARTAAAAPAWCDAAAIKRSSGSMSEVRDKDPRIALPAIVAQTCYPEHQSKVGMVQAARATWSTQLDLIEADWADIAAWAVLSQGERNGLRLKGGDTKRALSALDPLDQFAAIAYTKYSSGDAHYLTDALEPKLSEAGRLAYLGLCLESRRPVEWAMCQGDMVALDVKKLSAEVRANKTRPGHERAMVRITLALMRDKLVERATAIKELQVKEPGYAKLFALAADARKTYQVKPELRELALAMDDARALNSNKAGCGDKTWAALQATIGALPAKRFADLKDEPGNSFLDNVARVLANDANAYVAAAAHVMCNADQADALVVALGSAMQRWPGFRGPRNAALTAMVTGDVKLDGGARVDWPHVMRFGELRPSGVKWSAGRGPVSDVKRTGNQLTVAFVKKLRQESVCTDWKDTNKIVMISPSGQLIYDYICLKRGTLTINEASQPQTVDARYAHGIKAGVSVSIISGVVSGVWAKPGSAPIAVLGVPVK